MVLLNKNIFKQINMTLTSTTTLFQTGRRSNGNEIVRGAFNKFPDLFCTGI